jgi:polygalacturonase
MMLFPMTAGVIGTPFQVTGKGYSPVPPGVQNVQDTFGAYGDGIHDDTLVINGAIATVAAAGGGDLWFPNGTYNISAPINCANYVRLRGQTQPGTIIRWTPGFANYAAMIRFDSVINGGMTQLTLTMSDLTVAIVPIIVGGNSTNDIFDQLNVYGSAYTDGAIFNMLGSGVATFSNSKLQAQAATAFLSINVQQGTVTQTNLNKVNYAG